MSVVVVKTPAVKRVAEAARTWFERVRDEKRAVLLDEYDAELRLWANRDRVSRAILFLLGKKPVHPKDVEPYEYFGLNGWEKAAHEGSYWYTAAGELLESCADAEEVHVDTKTWSVLCDWSRRLSHG